VLSLHFSLFSSKLALIGALTHISQIILERNISAVLKTECIIWYIIYNCIWIHYLRGLSKVWDVDLIRSKLTTETHWIINQAIQWRICNVISPLWAQIRENLHLHWLESLVYLVPFSSSHLPVSVNFGSHFWFSFSLHLQTKMLIGLIYISVILCFIV